MIRFACLLVLALAGCRPHPKVGACDMPATEHEGYSLYACGVRQGDDTDVCCAYRNTGCYVVVCTRGCEDWVVAHQECGGES